MVGYRANERVQNTTKLHAMWRPALATQRGNQLTAGGSAHRPEQSRSIIGKAGWWGEEV